MAHAANSSAQLWYVQQPEWGRHAASHASTDLEWPQAASCVFLEVVSDQCMCVVFNIHFQGMSCHHLGGSHSQLHGLKKPGLVASGHFLSRFV